MQKRLKFAVEIAIFDSFIAVNAFFFLAFIVVQAQVPQRAVFYMCAHAMGFALVVSNGHAQSQLKKCIGKRVCFEMKNVQTCKNRTKREFLDVRR